MKGIKLFLLFVFFLLILFSMDLPVAVSQEAEWWNSTWHYRVRIEINSTNVDRVNWPIEIMMNFTKLMEESGIYGHLDINSIRVFEYNSSGSLLYEIPSQFDKGSNFDSLNNAYGELIFIMNGTTPANTKRIFYVYFDTEENGIKQAPHYKTSLKYNVSGDIINVNTSKLSFYIDLNRGEDSWGIFKVLDDIGNPVFRDLSETEVTAEYFQFTNGTFNFTFNASKISIVSGPVRTKIEIYGDERLWNTQTYTYELSAKKIYFFYSEAGPQDAGSFVKISEKINGSATRASTPAGAIGIDVNRTFNTEVYLVYNLTEDPYSYAYARGVGGEVVGVLNLEEINTSNFYASMSIEYGRVGITLENTQINGSIEDVSIFYFSATGAGTAVSEFLDIRNGFSNPLEKKVGSIEELRATVIPYTEFSIYNRNESVTIYVNLTDDPYNLVSSINATFDLGTLDASDDETITLYDDGTHGDLAANDKVFTGVFFLNSTSTVGKWNVTAKAYDSFGNLITQNTTSFNVTDVLNVFVYVINKYGLIERQVNASLTVKNFRNDTFISGASINCSYDSTPIDGNLTDFNNGTYLFSFKAPSTAGLYNLTCQANKLGNKGRGIDSFSADEPETFIEIEVSPETYVATSVTAYFSEWFIENVTVKNVGKGTAHSLNISLILPQGWKSNSTLEYCGLVEAGKSCTKVFNITIPPLTPSGNYSVFVLSNWTNPNGTFNSTNTTINVTVTSNPSFNVPETYVYNIVGHGKEFTLGNFTLNSTGNDPIEGINFTVYGLEDFQFEFIPNITSLEAGKTQSIQINVTIPKGYPPGNYSGILNVTTTNNGYDSLYLNITVSGAKVSLSISPTNYTSTKITAYISEWFEIFSNATNIGNVTAFNSYFSLILPQDWYANSTYKFCGNLSVNKSCYFSANITIPPLTPSGNYLVNVSFVWEDIGDGFNSTNTTINVTVTSNPSFNVPETYVYNIVGHGKEFTLGNFTLNSTGNDPIEGINFTVYGLEDFQFEFIPNITSLEAGKTQSIQINVTIPKGYPPGNYSGILNVTTTNNGYDSLYLNITVSSNRTWIMYPTYCEANFTVPEGLMCAVRVNNTGNLNISFNITPQYGNKTWVNVTSFEIEPQKSYVVGVYYNVTGEPLQFYNSTFIFDAIEEDSSPSFMKLRTVIYPYVGPLIEVNITPKFIPQEEIVEIYANITDRSQVGINWTKANITKPDGKIDTLEMVKVWENSDTYQSLWYVQYPSPTQNTTLRGTYNVTVYSKDNAGIVGYGSSEFYVYAKLRVFLSTYSDTYTKGSEGKIFYRVFDYSDTPLSNVSVNFEIWDPSGNLTYYGSFETNEEGYVYPLPQFSVSDDAPEGLYNLTALSYYFDPIVNYSTNSTNYKYFNVSGTSQVSLKSLYVDLETTVVWYPDNVMKFSIVVYNISGYPVDPENLNLTVLDPAENIYFQVTNISAFKREATGYYIYKYAMPSNTSVGAYTAIVNAKKGDLETKQVKMFRVSSGGPYDVRVVILNPEVSVGDTLYFDIYIENMGEVSQDVSVEYWMTNGTEVWPIGSEFVYVEAKSTRILPRYAFIYSDMSVGKYWLVVEVTYSYVQPSIRANSTFSIVKKVAPPTAPAPAPAPTVPTVVPRGRLSIFGLPSEVNVEGGGRKSIVFYVNNSGNITLTNIEISLSGILLTWYDITPQRIERLEPGEAERISIEFSPPSTNETKFYNLTLIITSNETSQRALFKLNVFRSREDLLRYEINNLEKKLEWLKNETLKKEAEGYEVSELKELIESAEKELLNAKEMLREKRYDDSLASIIVASNLIDKGIKLLYTVPKIKVVEVSRLPFWIIYFIAGAIVLAVLLVLLFMRMRIRKIEEKLHPKVEALKRVVPRPKPEEIEKEKKRLLRMLEILEKQYRKGIISAKAYEELKKRIEERLEKLSTY